MSSTDSTDNPELSAIQIQYLQINAVRNVIT